MEGLIPELRAVLQIPVATDLARQANWAAYNTAVEILKNTLERPGGVDIELLNTQAVLGLADTRRAFLRTARQWASWPDISDSTLFYAVLSAFWVSLGAGGCASVAEAEVLGPLCAAATERMGGWSTAMIAGARICSTIACIAAALPAPGAAPQPGAPQGFGAPPELLASFACHVLALFHDRPADFPATTDEANLAIERLRDRLPEGRVLVVRAATHALAANCFSGDAAAVLAEHIRNGLASPLVPMMVAGGRGRLVCGWVGGLSLPPPPLPVWSLWWQGRATNTPPPPHPPLPAFLCGRDVLQARLEVRRAVARAPGRPGESLEEWRGAAVTATRLCWDPLPLSLLLPHRCTASRRSST